MEMIGSKSKKANVFLGLLAVLGWFALVVQFYLMISGKAAPVLELLVRFFSFFTILTNLLVAVCSTVLAFFPDSKYGKYLADTQIQTAVTVYIVIVGLVYNTILRFLWQPEGMQRLVDELLHAVIPVLFLVYWLAFVPKRTLQWNNFWIWLVYPLVYLVVVMVRGWFSGYYPYPFLDLGKLEPIAVVANCVGITLLFVVFSLLLIGVGKWQVKRIA